VVGGLTDDGDRLGSVGGYTGKLSAASDIATVIVPEDDAATARLARPDKINGKDVHIDIAPAATWRAAAELARRRDRRAVLTGAVAAFAVISLLIGGGVALWQHTEAGWQAEATAAERAATISRRVAKKGAGHSHLAA
jgi:hypothetical protein